jgi:hypothetical protein
LNVNANRLIRTPLLFKVLLEAPNSNGTYLT